jgi:hypothetical protein
VRAAPILLVLLASGAAAAPAPPRTIAAKLEGVRVTCSFNRLPLDAWVQWVRAASGINVVVKRAAIAKELDPDAVLVTLELKDVALKDLLALALEPFGLATRIEGNVLFVTTKRDARGKPIVVLYDVSELLLPIRDFPAPEMSLYPSREGRPRPPEPEARAAFDSAQELVDLVRRFCGADTWEEEGVRVQVLRRHLLVRQYPEVHREIARFLMEIRALR